MHTTQTLVTCLHWGINCYWIQSSVKTTLHEVFKCTFFFKKKKSLEVPGQTQVILHMYLKNCF